MYRSYIHTVIPTLTYILYIAIKDIAHIILRINTMNHIFRGNKVQKKHKMYTKVLFK